MGTDPARSEVGASKTIASENKTGSEAMKPSGPPLRSWCGGSVGTPPQPRAKGSSGKNKSPVKMSS